MEEPERAEEMEMEEEDGDGERASNNSIPQNTSRRFWTSLNGSMETRDRRLSVKIFERWRSCSNSSEKERGSGVGL